MCSHCGEADDLCPRCGYKDCECDQLQEALREVYEHRQRLNATRDTVAVRASNANTRMLLDALGKSA